ncbi:MAG: class I tRNA ligase family protein, partial [Patescibacteria group bacterium]
MELPKAYNPKDVEDAIYKKWEDSGYFNPDKTSKHRNIEASKHRSIETRKQRSKKAKYFSIVMPPPNVTGTLHVGHAMTLALEDIMTRFHRMRGDDTVWIPGTDHAAIATQAKVEKLLKEKGQSRRSLGRQKFLAEVEKFAQLSQDTMRRQMRKMGSSCDWSREAYTLDEPRSLAVRAMFKKMYDDGLIYRGERVVNWCPVCASTLADDEVLYREEDGQLYYIIYKISPRESLVVATTRPETKLGDTALAVNPKDGRYKKYIGKEFDVDLAGHKIHVRVIPERSVDPNFGTGVVGVTPAHSMADSQMAEKNHLVAVKVIGQDAKMTEAAGKYAGLAVADARAKFVADLQTDGLIEKIEDIKHNVGICYRSETVVEQLPSKQWFVSVSSKFKVPSSKIKGIKSGAKASLKELALAAVKNGQIKILPERFEKTYFHWMNDLRDWCISRQIWFGHQIPVWYCQDCRKKQESKKEKKQLNNSAIEQLGIIVAIEAPKGCPSCKGRNIVQDPDTLDTWFSSGLWTFSTLGWPLTRVIFVRHGEAEGNANGVNDDGSADFVNKLTGRGRAQVEKTATALKEMGVKCIFSSPVLRAKQTAEIISSALDLEINFDERLRELGLGPYSGRPVSEYAKARFSMEAWIKDGKTVPQTESYEELKKRTSEFLRELVQTHIGETIAVVSHGDPIALMATFGDGRLWSDDYPAPGGIMQIMLDTAGRQSNELARFHPTSVLETAYDILFFWVARMILMTTYALGEIPFETVYLNGLVRDEQGRKMSKSLGNAIDPLTVAEKYGTDAVRLSLVLGTSPGNDVKLSEEKIAGFRNFTNKLWNIGRYVLSISNFQFPISKQIPNPKSKTLADRWLVSKLNRLILEVTDDLENFRFSEAGEKLREFTWGDFADWYIEINKIQPNNPLLLTTYYLLLKLWHPFMP